MLWRIAVMPVRGELLNSLNTYTLSSSSFIRGVRLLVIYYFSKVRQDRNLGINITAQDVPDFLRKTLDDYLSVL